MLLTTHPLDAQERVTPGEPFLADTLGWYFTDLQTIDLARDSEKLPLLQERIDAMEELLALKDWQIEKEQEYRGIYDGLLDDALKQGERSFWESIPPVVYLGAGIALGVYLRE